MTEHAEDGSDDTDGRETPWWHSEAEPPKTDSVLVEGMKLVTVLWEWAVESGAAAAAGDLAQAAASTAAGYVADVTSGEVDQADSRRCADCPVCRTLDALDDSNPQLADSARLVIAQVGGILAGLLPTDDDEDPE